MRKKIDEATLFFGDALDSRAFFLSSSSIHYFHVFLCGPIVKALFLVNYRVNNYRQKNLQMDIHKTKQTSHRKNCTFMKLPLQ